MNTTQTQQELIDCLIYNAVQDAVGDGKNDPQVAQNSAYAAALEHGFTEAEADEIAKTAGQSCPF